MLFSQCSIALLSLAIFSIVSESLFKRPSIMDSILIIPFSISEMNYWGSCCGGGESWLASLPPLLLALGDGTCLFFSSLFPSFFFGGMVWFSVFLLITARLVSVGLVKNRQKANFSELVSEARHLASVLYASMTGSPYSIFLLIHSKTGLH